MSDLMVGSIFAEDRASSRRNVLEHKMAKAIYNTFFATVNKIFFGNLKPGSKLQQPKSLLNDYHLRDCNKIFAIIEVF